MDDEYSIEKLVERFKMHAEYSMQEQRNREEKYLKDFGKPIPKHGIDPDFNILLAYMSICEEIVAIKEKSSKL